MRAFSIRALSFFLPSEGVRLEKTSGLLLTQVVEVAALLHDVDDWKCNGALTGEAGSTVASKEHKLAAQASIYCDINSLEVD
jgi:hypothetical protein